MALLSWQARVHEASYPGSSWEFPLGAWPTFREASMLSTRLSG
jgi:hypothetical protein